MKLTLLNWKKIDLYIQLALIVLFFGHLSLMNYNADYIQDYSFILQCTIFGLFAITQMSSFFLHRRYAPQYNSSSARKLYKFLLIVHHVMAASMVLILLNELFWGVIYLLFFSAIILSLLYLFITLFEILNFSQINHENTH